jgi:hypothetical protein
VVQVRSVLYPWGAIVVRTITIDRQDDSAIFRHDSGWVAATPGTFDPSVLPGITVHPGAVLGAFNIREIRDTTQAYKNAAVELTAVYFDADIQIDGVVSGASNGLAPSIGQLGFVQTKPVLGSLQPPDLADLIASQGALGGPVDCVIAVAGTAQTMRISRVEIANAPQAGAATVQEFAAAARGSLVLPASGSWSVLARTDNASEPTPIDADRGVPLIRQGPAGGPPGATPWRLAEPVDLGVPDTPSMDYCLLHATESTRVLFPRPKIESGSTAFISTQAPLLADGFALLEATGICPRQDACLKFPDANYELQIGGAGEFTLANVPDSFLPSRPDRALASGAAAAIGFEYQDEKQPPTPTQVSVAIQPDSWSVGLKGVNVRLDITPFTGLMRFVGDMQAASGSGVSFSNGKLVLGSVLQPLQDMLTFLKSLRPPGPLKLSFSNSGWTRTYKSSFASIQFDIPPPILPDDRDSIKVGGGFGKTTPESDPFAVAWVFDIDFEIIWAFGTFPPPPLALVGILKFEAVLGGPFHDAPPESETLKLQLGVALHGKKDLVPGGSVQLEGMIAIAITLVLTSDPTQPPFGLGGGIIADGSFQISTGAVVFVQIQLTLEFDFLVVQFHPPVAQGTFDIQFDITIAWCVDVSWEAKYQFTQDLT